MAIFMKYGAVTGEARTTGFDGQIELTSFEFGIGRAIASARGTSTRESSEAGVSEIVVTKLTDGASLKLMEEALYGKLDNKVDITFTRTLTGGGTQAYLKYSLEGCGISGFSSRSGGDRPTESISLNFDKFTKQYGKIGDDLANSSATSGYDLATAAKL
jgi:type VI secretion system secreted protein Hcp